MPRSSSPASRATASGRRAFPTTSPACWSPVERPRRPVVRIDGRERVDRRAGGHGAARAAVAVELVDDLPEALPALERQARRRPLRGRILEGRRPGRAVPEELAVAQRRRPRAHLHCGLPRVREAPAPGLEPDALARWGAPRDARRLTARG